MKVLLPTLLALAALHGTHSLTMSSDSKSGHDSIDLSQLTARLALLEGQVRKLGDLEHRVQQLELVVRMQNKRLRSQGRQLTSLDQLLGRSAKYQSGDKNLSPEQHGNESNTSDRESERQTAGIGISPGPSSGVADDKIVHNPVSKRGIRSAEGVAFSTYLNHDTGPLGEHQVVKFNTVQFNDGDGYNQYTGTFTCPVAGVYLFLYNMGHQGVGQTWLELMVNGRKTNAATVQTLQSLQENQGGNSVIVRLAAGETVWVEAWYTSYHAHDNTLDGHHFLTTFSGVLIY